MDASYRDLVRQLSEFEPPVYIFGGVAEDALLEGSLDRPHGDLDVLVRRCELPERIEQMRRVGFSSIDVYYEPLPGRPLVLGGTSRGLCLEFGIIDEDDSGFYFVAGESEGGLQRVELTGDLFAYPPVLVDSVGVHVASPLALYQIREAFMRLGTFGAPREKDIAMQRQLQDLLEHGGVDVLPPPITPLADVEPLSL